MADVCPTCPAEKTSGTVIRLQNRALDAERLEQRFVDSTYEERARIVASEEIAEEAEEVAEAAEAESAAGGALTDPAQQQPAAWQVDGRRTAVRVLGIATPLLAVGSAAITAKRTRSSLAGIAVGAGTWVGLGILHRHLSR